MTTKTIGLERLGLPPRRDIHHNLPAPTLIEHAIRREEGVLVRSGALATKTGARTGRSPDAKFLADEPGIREDIWWGEVNRPMPPETFERFRLKVADHLSDRELYVFDGFAGADPEYRLPVRVVTEKAWHNLFAHQLFLETRPIGARAARARVHGPPRAGPRRRSRRRHGSNAFVLGSFGGGLILIGGTHYAGEIKKSIFSVMNCLMPQRGVLPMHCSANVGRNGDTALFFGLSGTGKTTLSADPERRLIGDDEHGWSTDGVFNFEGGCYAKCIRLSQEKEPEIWAAIRFGSVVENVVVDPVTRAVDYDDDSITENTRAAYPVDFIPNAMIPGIGGHPRTIVFLTADAFGVLPPIARLSREQAMYHFIRATRRRSPAPRPASPNRRRRFRHASARPSSHFTLALRGDAGQAPRPARDRRVAREHRLDGRTVRRGASDGAQAHAGDGLCGVDGKLDEDRSPGIPYSASTSPTRCPTPDRVLDPRATWTTATRTTPKRASSRSCSGRTSRSSATFQARSRRRDLGPSPERFHPSNAGSVPRALPSVAAGGCLSRDRSGMPWAT